ncbi:MAG: hypothetical protein IOC54_01420 [Methylobacterium sp.]|nr:hypothetical protein [Methylobacterium sp.]MCA3650480.1 hypothetical protein [Methylobacterium sp.]MCA4923360.1 hypothetical protein [Methylobacterium sp.]
MLEIFKKLRTGPVSAQALREARAALDPHVVETTVRKREDARREAILSGDPKEIARAETALADARMEAERITIAVEELEARIAEADRREAEETVQAAMRDIVKRRDAVRRRIELDLVPALRTASTVLTALAEIDSEIAAWNSTNYTTPERVLDLAEVGLTPIPESESSELWSLRHSTVIRPIPEWGVPGYNHRPPPFVGIAFAPREATDPKFRPAWR